MIFKMSWLATWFIFELIGVGAASDLSEPQVFISVSLQMMTDQTFTLRRIFYKKNCNTFKFNAQYEWPKRKRKRYPFIISSFLFHKNLSLPPLPLPNLCLQPLANMEVIVLIVKIHFQANPALILPLCKIK